MKYFKEDEFQGFYKQLNKDLKTGLDTVRDKSKIKGLVVAISPAPGAVGRHLGTSKSGHNIDYWDEVMAVDIMPKVKLKTKRRALTKSEAEVFYSELEEHFDAIGVYPFWKPVPGFHVQIRDRKGRWSDIDIKDSAGNRQYQAIEAGFEEWK